MAPIIFLVVMAITLEASSGKNIDYNFKKQEMEMSNEVSDIVKKHYITPPPDQREFICKPNDTTSLCDNEIETCYPEYFVKDCELSLHIREATAYLTSIVCEPGKTYTSYFRKEKKEGSRYVEENVAQYSTQCIAKYKSKTFCQKIQP